MTHETIKCEECGETNMLEGCESDGDHVFCSESCLDEYENNKPKKVTMDLEKLEKSYQESEESCNGRPHQYEHGKFQLLNEVCEYLIKRGKQERAIQEITEKFKEQEQ